MEETRRFAGGRVWLKSESIVSRHKGSARPDPDAARRTRSVRERQSAPHHHRQILSRWGNGQSAQYGSIRTRGPSCFSPLVLHYGFISPLLLEGRHAVVTTIPINRGRETCVYLLICLPRLCRRTYRPIGPRWPLTPKANEQPWPSQPQHQLRSHGGSLYAPAGCTIAAGERSLQRTDARRAQARNAALVWYAVDEAARERWCYSATDY
jgi:hypothetical protein